MKKFYFAYGAYAQMDALDGVVVFEKNKEQAIAYFKEILASEDFQKRFKYVDFEDFGEPEQMLVLNPKKTFKGYYVEPSSDDWDV